MKSLLTKASIFALVALLASCKSFYGDLEVIESVSINTKKGAKTLSAGSYASVLEIASKREATLKIKVPGGGDKNDVLTKIKLPRGKEFPVNGGFVLTGKEIGQTFDLTGEVRTSYVDGKRRYDRESCVYQERVVVCERDREGRKHCYARYVDRHGFQDIEYFVRSENALVALELKSPKDAKLLGKLSGKHTSDEKIVTWRGRCGY